MPVLATPWNVPGLDIETVRGQFEAIWEKNVVEVDVIRNTNPQGGDYFHDDEEPGPQTRKIWMNVQGTKSDFYLRKNYGITTTESEYHAYCRYYEDIQNNDRIVWGGKRFVVSEHNKSMYNGMIAFQEFNLKKVSQSD